MNNPSNSSANSSPAGNQKFTGRILLLLAVFLLAVVGFLLSQLMEYTEQVEDEGPSWQVSANPFLAAENWLTQQNIKVTHLYDQAELDLAQADIVISQGRFDESFSIESDADKLVQWLTEGGQLIMQPAGEVELPGGLSSLNAIRARSETIISEEIMLELEGEIPLSVNFDSEWYLTDPEDQASVKVVAADGYWLLGYGVGEGWLWLVSDLTPFTSEYIDQKDHGLLLWVLLGRPDENSQLQVLLNPEYPNILQLIWQYWKYPLLSLLMILVAWIVSGLQRFGPVIPKPDNARRELSEHLQASGIYLWRHGATDKLLQSVRLRLQRRLASRWPAWRQWSRKQQILRLVELTGEPEQQISDWLYGQMPKEGYLEGQLIEQLRGLWKLGRSLGMQQKSISGSDGASK